MQNYHAYFCMKFYFQMSKLIVHLTKMWNTLRQKRNVQYSFLRRHLQVSILALMASCTWSSPVLQGNLKITQGNASYRKLLIALHLKSNLKSQFFNQFCFIFMWLGRNMTQFPINSPHLCPWSDMLTNEHDNPSNSNKNFWFLKRIYLIHYTVITVESKPCL